MLYTKSHFCLVIFFKKYTMKVWFHYTLCIIESYFRRVSFFWEFLKVKKNDMYYIQFHRKCQLHIDIYIYKNNEIQVQCLSWTKCLLHISRKIYYILILHISISRKICYILRFSNRLKLYWVEILYTLIVRPLPWAGFGCAVVKGLWRLELVVKGLWRGSKVRSSG